MIFQQGKRLNYRLFSLNFIVFAVVVKVCAIISNIVLCVMCFFPRLFALTRKQFYGFCVEARNFYCVCVCMNLLNELKHLNHIIEYASIIYRYQLLFPFSNHFFFVSFHSVSVPCAVHCLLFIISIDYSTTET